MDFGYYMEISHLTPCKKCGAENPDIHCTCKNMYLYEAYIKCMKCGFTVHAETAHTALYATAHAAYAWNRAETFLNESEDENNNEID